MTALSATGGKTWLKPVPPRRGPSPSPPHHLPRRKKVCSRVEHGCSWAALCCSPLEPGVRFSFGRSPEGGRPRWRRRPYRKRRASASVLHWFSRARVLANLRRDRLNPGRLHPSRLHMGRLHLGRFHLDLLRRCVPLILHLIHSPRFWIVRPPHQPTLGLQRSLRRLFLRMLWISRPWKS